MAIESLYWKEELTRIAKLIRPVARPKRWSERAVCTVERDVMIGCFIVRRLIELHKVSSRVAKLQLGVFSVPVIKDVNKMSRFSIEENYDWKVEKAESKAVSYICNQCIHAYVSVVTRATDRNWSDLFVVSDYDRNSVIWRIPFSILIQLFETAAKDWPASHAMTYDDDLGDYRVTTD
jgi:hypothetical protein